MRRKNACYFADFKKREQLQEFFDFGVFGANPILIELIRAGLRWVQPYGIARGLAEFLARARCEKRKRYAEGFTRASFANQLDSRGDVAPLVAAATLNRAGVVIEQV